jgi:uncharacterized protein YndB with AHSA1/START domain
MNEPIDKLVVEVSKVISASIDKTFDAWLDAGVLATFILPKPGMPNPEVSVDPVVGGEFEIVMDVGDRKIPHHGVYRQIDRPHTLQFSWNSPFSAENSEVTITFREINPGQTEITLVHQNFPDQESRDNHDTGWSNILDALGAGI